MLSSEKRLVDISYPQEKFNLKTCYPRFSVLNSEKYISKVFLN